MRELNTKKGVLLITYTQYEVDRKVEEFLETNDSDGCRQFLDGLRSFNPESSSCITTEEAEKYTGLEKKKNKSNPYNLYTNYKGTPFGIHINEIQLLFKDPVLSLKSAFERGAPEFDYELDFFLPTKEK
jgi:hypothetical protein